MNNTPRALSRRIILATAVIVLALAFIPGCQNITVVNWPGESNTSSSASSEQANSSSSNPNGYGAVEEGQTVGNLEFRNYTRLKEHYQKHGIEMGYSSAEDYLAGANAVITNPNALHKQESDDGDDCYYLENTGEFVVVSQQGVIRTYYTASRSYFDRQ